MAEEPIHVSQTEARGGTTSGVTRYVLAVSMALIVVVFGVLLIYWR